MSQSHNIKGETTDVVFQECVIFGKETFLTFKIFYMHKNKYTTLKGGGGGEKKKCL